MAQTTLPEYHFLYVAPSLESEWLFEAGRAYWERFMPTVLGEIDFLALLPQNARIVVTAIARRDVVAEVGVEIARRAPQALFDPVVRDTLAEMQAALDERAALNAPFGVPIQPLSPAPGSILATPAPTRPPGGFVTQTPTPGGEAMTEPTTTPNASAPIHPTPGPIIGG